MKKTSRYSVLLVIGLLITPLLQAADAGKPNIIFILADDLGYGDVGFNGQKKFKTPNIDKMTQDGVRMANFYSGAPVCGPSRAALMYGQHSGHSPIRRNPGWTADGKGPSMGVNDIILPKELKRAGYTTGVIGKWGLNDDVKTTNLGQP
jgi:arylsulfatase A